jgi:hypothetical protein
LEEKIERRTEVMGRQERRHEQLLDDFKGTRICWKMEEETLRGRWQFVKNSLGKRLLT